MMATVTKLVKVTRRKIQGVLSNPQSSLQCGVKNVPMMVVVVTIIVIGYGDPCGEHVVDMMTTATNW